jgi:uncharacterized protein (DUF983 family)
VLVTEKLWHPNLLLSAVLWLIVTLALTVFLMPRVKGAVVAAQWALRMHGFDYASRDDGELPSLDKGPAARA